MHGSQNIFSRGDLTEVCGQVRNRISTAHTCRECRRDRTRLIKSRHDYFAPLAALLATFAAAAAVPVVLGTVGPPPLRLAFFFTPG